MVPNGDKTPEMPEAVVNYSKLGYSYNRISGNVNKIIPSSILEIFSISKSSVSTTVKKYSKSKNFDSAKRTGRPKNLNDRDMRALERMIGQKPEISSTELAKEINEIKPHPISPSTITMQLLKKGIRTYSDTRTQFLGKIAMKRRLE